jgi:AraC-like DNA-binding protein
MERRRSDRLFESVPLIVRGIDLLGQPFEERTGTLAFNLHGCRYSSKHHLPRNTWITLELPQAPQRPNVRARVAWVQRPHSIRDFFQIAVELEGPANIWGIEALPAGWTTASQSSQRDEDAVAESKEFITEKTETEPVSTNATTFPGTLMNDKNESLSASELSAANSPLFRELRKELEAQAQEAIAHAAKQVQEEFLRAADESDRKRTTAIEEFFGKWKAQFERAQTGTREELSNHLAERQDEFLRRFKAEFEKNFGNAHELMDELNRRVETLRGETESAREAAGRLAQARLQLEATEASLEASRAKGESSRGNSASGEDVITAWRQTLTHEMSDARAQWNELLQSSLDSNVQRLIEQITQRSQDVLRDEESKIRECVAEARQPLTQISSEARETLGVIKASLDQEVARARASLSEIESVASGTKEYSAQLEAASHDTLNELHRRLEKILESQTAELNRRADNLAAGMAQRIGPALDTLQQQYLHRTLAQAEVKLAPHLERVPELLRELAAREVQAEEGLRLHRERLRQASENNQRDVSAQLAATVADVRNDFEFARKDALAKWSEELDASGVRAAHSAGESIGRSSEWFQQEARARLQVLVEQTITSAATGFEEKTGEATKAFGVHLAGESANHLAQIREQAEGIAGEAAGHARGALDKAAEAAASSFGEVLRDISAQQAEQFADSSRNTVGERAQELERSAQQVLQRFEASAGDSVQRLQALMESQLGSSMEQARAVFSREFTSDLESYRAERDAHHDEWAQSLDELSNDAVAKYQERLQTAGDSWIVSSVRRLSEHGQNVIESMLRSADLALRESCSKVFDGLAEMLRERSANAAGVAGFKPGMTPNRDVESPGS